MRRKSYVGFLLLFQLFVILSLILYISQTREIKPFVFQDALQIVLNNQYFVNVICSFVVIFIIYYLQIGFCKRKLMKDIRFKEELSHMGSSVELAESMLSDLKSSKDTLVEFFDKHGAVFEVLQSEFVNLNGSIILESINTVFFINLNFKLLEVLNNIKSCNSNLNRTWEYIVANISDNKVTENVVSMYFIYLKDICNYLRILFKYFYYDVELEKLAFKFLTTDIRAFLDMSEKEMKKEMKKAYRKARKEISANKSKKH